MSRALEDFVTREQGCGDVGWGLEQALPQKLRLLTPGGGGGGHCQGQGTAPPGSLS